MSDERAPTPDTPTATKNEAWRLLHRYWLEKHVDGRPPRRTELDPITEVPRLVANLMILEAAGESFLYRFVGTEVVEQTGQDMTGREVGISLRFSPIRLQWLSALRAVRADRHPRLLMYRFDVGVTAKQLVLILPLQTEPDEPAMILGGSFLDGYFPPGLKVEGITVQEVLG